MIKEEIIKLNDEEYTAVLNRQSALKIEQYTDLQNSIKEIQKTVFTHIDEIKENEDPFAEEIDIDKMQEDADKKVELLHKIIERAFWIWLYPKHSLNINEVKELINPYFESGNENDLKYITELYGDLLRKSTEISEKYFKEQKNLKAQTNK